MVECKKKFFADFQENFSFSWVYPYKMGNYQWIFYFSIGEALYRSLPYIRNNISYILEIIFRNKAVALK